MHDDHVAGILLAAGAATRFGADKLAAEFCGQTLLHRSAAAMADAELQPVIAVAQPNASHSVPGGVRAVENDRWKSGISTSVRAGLAALHRETSVCAAIVAPADQPWCGPDVYRRLVDAFRRTGRGLIVATFHGALRNPVLVARAHWRLADEIDGDVGLSAAVRPLSPMTVECSDIGSADDIDTPADLFRALQSPNVSVTGTPHSCD